MVEHTMAPESQASPDEPPVRRRRGLFVAVSLWTAVLVAIPLVFVVVQHGRRHPHPLPVTSSASGLRATGIPASVPTNVAGLMGLSPVPLQAAPDFTLVDQNGRSLSLAGLRGKTVVLTFMDPHCVDICPVVSQEFLDAYQDLGTAAADVVFVAVNVNSFHATVADVAAFSGAHRLSSIPSWHFVTGTPAQMQAVWAGYGVTVAEKSANADIVHTSIVYFIDPRGQERFVAAPQVDYTTDGTAYLPPGDLASWGQGIALTARSIS